MLTVLLIQFCHLIAALACNQDNSISAYNRNNNIFIFDENDIPDYFIEIIFPNVPDQLGVLSILALSVWDDFFAEPKAHQISILKANIASLVFGAHDYAAYFVGLLLAY